MLIMNRFRVVSPAHLISWLYSREQGESETGYMYYQSKYSSLLAHEPAVVHLLLRASELFTALHTQIKENAIIAKVSECKLVPSARFRIFRYSLDSTPSNRPVLNISHAS